MIATTSRNVIKTPNKTQCNTYIKAAGLGRSNSPSYNPGAPPSPGYIFGDSIMNDMSGYS